MMGAFPPEAAEAQASPRTPGGIPLQEVRRVAVLRALSLGDMVCATPALRALRTTFPRASVTLVGQGWASDWARRIDAIDEFIALPPHPLVGQETSPSSWSNFVSRMQGLQLDLALQMHGSGGVSNGIVCQWGARENLVFHEPGVAAPADTFGVPWPERGSEPLRLMRLLHPLGVVDEPSAPLSLVHPVSPQDRQELAALLAACGMAAGRGVGWVCVHPGSKWPSRRWAAERFAQVALELSQRGHDILLTGGEPERALAEQICQRVPRAINLCGRTTLWTLGAAIEGARLLVCNDTGVSHIAAALSVPSVVISCGSDVARWSPANPLRHRVLWSAPPCRPCMAHACTQPTHLCAQDIRVEQVLSACQEALVAGH